MARQKFTRTTWWFLSLQMTVYLFFIFVQAAEEDDAFKNGKNLVLEYFLPINLPAAMEMPVEREKRDVEGSGEDGTVFSELHEKSAEGDETDNSKQNSFARMIVEGEKSNLTNFEGSGEVDASETREISSEEDDASSEPINLGTEDSVEVSTSEVVKSEESEEVTVRVTTEQEPVTTEMIFDKSEDFKDEISSETTTNVATTESEEILEKSTTEIPAESTVVVEQFPTTMPTELNESTTTETVDTTVEFTTIPAVVQTTQETISPTEATTVIPLENIPEDSNETVIVTTPLIEETTLSPVEIIPPEETTLREETTPGLDAQFPPDEASPSVFDLLPPVGETSPKPIELVPSVELTSPKVSFETFTSSTEGLPVEVKPDSTTAQPIIEEVFKQVKTAHKSLEAMPGNILRKENLTLGADPLLIVTNTRLMDSEETVQLSSAEPKRMGAYIVIGLILLSFFSLVGYITFRKRLNRKRQDFESNQETNDTEKALLSLSDYKDNSELEENHLKNNEITPIVVKSNTQLNKFEKNTNFSSPKNLNTIANEKNIEKDNVLKSTAENLTQVIIEDSPKDVEEDKNAPGMEKLIVKTRIDQDSIPKKPIIINRTSTGYMPIPQDNV